MGAGQWLNCRRIVRVTPKRHALSCHSLVIVMALAVLTLVLPRTVIAQTDAPPQSETAAPSGDQPDSNARSPKTAKKKAEALTISILMVRQERDGLPPLSLLDLHPEDDGLAGAKLAISDNNTTGRFLNQAFVLDDVKSADPKELIAKVVERVEAGTGFVVADVEPNTLLAIADALKGKDAIVFNAGAPDDRLRGEDCRDNVKHTAPSRAMLTDALAQYLAWKQWRNWFLIVGPTEQDAAFANALKRAAKRFGQKIVEERKFDYDPGSRRADGGFEQIQQQIPSFTQDAAEHDVVIVADEGELFGDYFPYRTWQARPVAGTAGLFPTSWHAAVELWGATQFQNRFKRMTSRHMRPLDYNVWMAVRSVGEAATRTRSNSPKELINYMRSPEFELAAFKGQRLTYRDWNGQLRQPVIVATDKLHVTVSPQPGFLHQFSELDTLGVDKPESKCQAFAQ